MHRARAKFLSTIAAALPVLAATTVARAETPREWAIRALRHQSNLDAIAPLSRTTWVGTHNSYANPKDDNLQDYNQPMSLKDQLRAGVREIVFDVHYEGDKILLCHNNSNTRFCADGSTGNRKLSRGLDDIKEWIRDEGNANQVVLLKLELADSARRNINKVQKVLGNHIESYVHLTRWGTDHGNLDASTGCTRLPSMLTKQQVLDQGRNIVIVTTPGSGSTSSTAGCVSDGDFNDLVYYGADTVGSGGKEPADMAAKTDKDVVLYRVKDAATNKGRLGSDPEEDVKLKRGNVAAWLDAGLNVFETFGYGATDAKSWTVGLYGALPVQPEDMVWSWAVNSPKDSGDEDCAIAGTDGRLTDVRCDGARRHACYSATAGWAVTAAKGAWLDGFAACTGGTKFAVPTSKPDFNALKAAMAGVNEPVWVNYSDRAAEGEWIANVPSTAWFDGMKWVSTANFGGAGGSAFSDYDQLVLDLYRGRKREIRKIELAAGKRVDMVRITYSDGRVVSHGSGKVSDTRQLSAASEFITSIEVCVAEYKKRDQVVYLKFTTNKGAITDGGDRRGDCREFSEPGMDLFALRGRAGDALDAISFYFRPR